MTVADPAGDAPAAGDRDGLPRRGFSASCGTRAGTFGGPGSFAKSLPTTSHSGSSAPSPGNDLLKLRWKPEVRVVFGMADCRSRAAAPACRLFPCSQGVFVYSAPLPKLLAGARQASG